MEDPLFVITSKMEYKPVVYVIQFSSIEKRAFPTFQMHA